MIGEGDLKKLLNCEFTVHNFFFFFFKLLLSLAVD